jgi:gliding motility-associated-like protein
MTPVICFGDSTGTVSVVASGGTPGYSYLWDTGDTTANVSGLPIGTYSVEVIDTNGCSDTASVVVTEPTELIGQISRVDVLCHGESTGSVSTVISGGITPYSYAWNNGDVTGNINNVPAGPYEVLVTDDNGCTITLFDTILEPASPISSSIDINQNLCFGDSLATVDLTVQGGVESFSYAWSTGDTTEDLSGLPAGDYIVLITDTNACTLLDTAFVTHPDLITATEVIENVSCFGFSDGAIDITPDGGTGAYTYSWSTGATTQDVNGLPAGNYSVTITDANNCSQSFTYTITEPDPLNVVYSLEMPDCFGFSNGSLTPQVTGGTTPYNYSWDNGVTTAINDQIPTGDYTLTVTDDNGCVFELECFLPEPPELQVSFTVDTTAGCEPVELNFSNTSDEAIIAYQWNFGDGSFGSASEAAHTYFDVGCKDVTLTITDVNNCSNSVTYQDYVCIYRTPTAALEASPDQLFSGIAETTVSNLSMDATSYIWDMGDATGLYTFFEPGLYTYPDFYLEEYTITLTAISEVGCRDTASIELDMDNEPIIYVPNTFTPDGDQYNNTFKPVLPAAMEDYRLTIWNRWGEVLFESFDPAIGWDGTYGGKMVQDGTYIWTIRMQPPGVDEPVTKTGSVNVLR